LNNKPGSTAADWGLLILRLTLAAVFIAHGAQKLFGAFDGPGLGGVVQMLGPVGYLVSIGEFFGGIGLLVGILPRFSAAALAVIMVGAIVKVHLAKGFFMAGGGYEFALSLLGLSIALAIMGPGRFSISEHVSLKQLFGKRELATG
jgi:putative oxidoreductase